MTAHDLAEIEAGASDLGFHLSQRFSYVLIDADPVVAMLVSDFARWMPDADRQVVWFDFATPATTAMEVGLDPLPVLDSLAKRCLGPSWSAWVSWGRP